MAPLMNTNGSITPARAQRSPKVLSQPAASERSPERDGAHGPVTAARGGGHGWQSPGELQGQGRAPAVGFSGIAPEKWFKKGWG